MSQTQKTVAKPANKPANKPAKASTKPATQETAKQEPAQVGAQYFIKDSFRPRAGRMLFAYTMAWLQETGLIDGGAISRDQATKLAGATAIGYHVNRTGRMVDKDGSISLAPGGANFFADRQHDGKDREAFATMLRTGQPDGERIKAAAAFGPLKPAKADAKPAGSKPAK